MKNLVNDWEKCNHSHPGGVTGHSAGSSGGGGGDKGEGGTKVSGTNIGHAHTTQAAIIARTVPDTFDSPLTTLQDSGQWHLYWPIPGLAKI